MLQEICVQCIHLGTPAYGNAFSNTGVPQNIWEGIYFGVPMHHHTLLAVAEGEIVVMRHYSLGAPHLFMKQCRVVM